MGKNPRLVQGRPPTLDGKQAGRFTMSFSSKERKAELLFEAESYATTLSRYIESILFNLSPQQRKRIALKK